MMFTTNAQLVADVLQADEQSPGPAERHHASHAAPGTRCCRPWPTPPSARRSASASECSATGRCATSPRRVGQAARRRRARRGVGPAGDRDVRGGGRARSPRACRRYRSTPRRASASSPTSLTDSEPSAVLAAADAELPPALGALPRLDVDLEPHGVAPRSATEPDPERPALIVYTSGTTGPPKGVVLPRRAIGTNLDALADAWEWTEHDVLVHGLPLFHVHGLVLGVLGPLRRGGTVHHLGSFSVDGATTELAGPASMMFGVPTMYHRLADAAEQDRAVAEALAPRAAAGVGVGGALQPLTTSGSSAPAASGWSSATG